MRDGMEGSLPGWLALGAPPTITLAPTDSHKEPVMDDSAMGATFETTIASRCLLIYAPVRLRLGGTVSVAPVRAICGGLTGLASSACLGGANDMS